MQLSSKLVQQFILNLHHPDRAFFCMVVCTCSVFLCYYSYLFSMNMTMWTQKAKKDCLKESVNKGFNRRNIFMYDESKVVVTCLYLLDQSRNIYRGIFWIFKYSSQLCFICHTSNCRRMLGSNLRLMRLWHWQSDSITTRLDLIHTRLDLIHHSARSHPPLG
jgi:hypothetical protein